MDYEHDDSFLCPYCGQTNALIIDLTGPSYQELVTDCEVCCAPILIRVKTRGEEIISLDVTKENG